MSIKQEIEKLKDEAWKANCLSIAEITDNNMKTDIFIFDKGFDAGSEKTIELLLGIEPSTRLAEQILEDYVKPDDTVDMGNLYFAATTYRQALASANAKIEHWKKDSHEMREAYDKLVTKYEKLEVDYNAMCDKVDKANYERDTLKLKLEQAEKVIEFYADRKNWNDRFYESPDGNEDNDGDIFDVIAIEDVEICTDANVSGVDESYVGHYTHGGKLARTYLTTKTQVE